MDIIYVLGYFVNGKFEGYVRKGRNNSISAYDSIYSAKRGLSQSRIHESDTRNYKIIRFIDGINVEF